MARRLHQRLLELGASELAERGLGDDQDPLGYDSALEIWQKVGRYVCCMCVCCVLCLCCVLCVCVLRV